MNIYIDCFPRLPAGCEEGGEPADGDGAGAGRLLRPAVAADRGGGRAGQRGAAQGAECARHRAHSLQRPTLPLHHPPRHRPPRDHQGHRAQPQPGVLRHQHRRGLLPPQHGPPSLLPSKLGTKEGQDCSTSGKQTKE